MPPSVSPQRSTNFNSQPHKEADEQDVCCEYDRVISTHSLTRRLTLQMVSHEAGSAISTHSLTRRLTLICLRFRLQLSHFNSQPHKEADSCIASTMAFLVYFNSQPHKEADFLFQFQFPVLRYFNSQPHKEADFPVGLVYFHRFLFQLTASQGG